MPRRISARSRQHAGAQQRASTRSLRATRFSKDASSRWKPPIACSRGDRRLRHPQGAGSDARRNTARRRSATAACSRAGWSKPASATSTSTIPAGRTGTRIGTSSTACASTAPTWIAPPAALIRDLKRRGLLDETLVVWGGEFGRTPVSESGNGRDHNPYGFTMWVAGGGIKGGQAVRRDRRVRLQGRGEPRVDSRPARHAAESARHGSHEADVPLSRDAISG